MLFSLLAGCVLGTVFFGGLLWTIQRGLTSKLPALWFFASSCLRSSIALVGIYFVIKTGEVSRSISRVGFCLLGFLAVRFVIGVLGRNHRPRASGAHDAA